MQLPTQVTFSIADDEYRPASGEAGQPGYVAAEKFGPDYAGDITIRYPTIQDTIEISCRVTAAIEAFGVRDTTAISARIYNVLYAMVFFSTVGVVRPKWIADTEPAEIKKTSAIIYAHERALARLEDGKKNSASVGESSSTGT